MQIHMLAVALMLVLAACQSEEAATEPEATVRVASPPDALVYIISPEDGATISGREVKVIFGLSGMGVAPAGVDMEGTGHHHLLVDVVELPDMDMPVPADSNHIHFGLGQTEAVLSLAPGSHTLQLLLGDYRHIPHDPPVASAAVTIVVE